MKTRIKFIAIIFIAFLFNTGCEDTLKPEIYSQLSDANYPISENDINTSLTSYYAIFTHDWNTSDNSGENYQGTYNVMYSWMHINSASTDECNDTWAPEYKMAWGSAFDTKGYVYNKIRYVSRATQFLEVLKSANISEPSRKSTIAQVKCIRAWIMFMLYDWYGPVNVKLDPENINDTIIVPRPAKEEYLNAMISDLNDAIPDLIPKTNQTSDWGRVNQGLARTLLMKIYMNDHQWDKAKIVCQDLLSMGYSLQGEYKDVFIYEGNKEIIWAVPSGPGYANWWMGTNLPWDAKTICGIDVAPGWSGYYMPWKFYDKYTVGDKRLETIGSAYKNIDGGEYVHGSGDEGWDLPTGAIAVKYLVPKELNSVGNFSTVGMRYADVLLSMSEIENELNKSPNSSAISFAKQVTDRAGISIPASATANYKSFKDFLLDERGRELYWEGWRRQDLIRFGKYIETGLSLGWPAKDNMNLFPLPPQVMIEGRGIVVNNPGY